MKSTDYEAAHYAVFFSPSFLPLMSNCSPQCPVRKHHWTILQVFSFSRRL